uniref:Protein RFT1 homolog n=1 Tax=Macrostomum lignano TaxID=282301 RepID=A0A1I8FKT9_9PLAT
RSIGTIEDDSRVTLRARGRRAAADGGLLGLQDGLLEPAGSSSRPDRWLTLAGLKLRRSTRRIMTTSSASRWNIPGFRRATDTFVFLGEGNFTFSNAFAAAAPRVLAGRRPDDLRRQRATGRAPWAQGEEKECHQGGGHEEREMKYWMKTKPPPQQRHLDARQTWENRAGLSSRLGIRRTQPSHCGFPGSLERGLPRRADQLHQGFHAQRSCCPEARRAAAARAVHRRRQNSRADDAPAPYVHYYGKLQSAGSDYYDCVGADLQFVGEMIRRGYRHGCGRRPLRRQIRHAAVQEELPCKAIRSCWAPRRIIEDIRATGLLLNCELTAASPRGPFKFVRSMSSVGLDNSTGPTCSESSLSLSFAAVSVPVIGSISLAVGADELPSTSPQRKMVTPTNSILLGIAVSDLSKVLIFLAAAVLQAQFQRAASSYGWQAALLVCNVVMYLMHAFALWCGVLLALFRFFYLQYYAARPCARR